MVFVQLLRETAVVVNMKLKFDRGPSTSWSLEMTEETETALL
uniref:Uncharacterized protein n=1 Tax=Physcomitrium patens TaxID=3218 RepID=A0A2K1J1F3_PHYPA|nr:hypothetical protein PHYPA_023252 [Physcomitrium patens]